MAADAHTTTDHDTIRNWAEKRGGKPATVPGTEAGAEDAGILRIDFPGQGAELKEISWEEFFDKFDKSKLAFIYQEKTEDGNISRFSKFVSRESAA